MNMSIFHVSQVLYSSVFTDDECRVKLEPIEGEEGSDYINASFIEVNCVNKRCFNWNAGVTKRGNDCVAKRGND